MHIHSILESSHQLSSYQNKTASFALIGSITKTCNIKGITQAGIPGFIDLTPTLDAEFIATGNVYSMPKVASTPSGVPTPALITKGVDLVHPFKKISIIDAGMAHKPQNVNEYIAFNIQPCEAINGAQPFDAKEVFEKGKTYGHFFKVDADYLIVGESTPSGTTTAQASLEALGLDIQGCFASSFADVPSSTKDEVIQASLKKINHSMSDYEKLGHTSDQMLLFSAGFISALSHNSKIMLAGGTQMAAMLHIMQTLTSSYNAQNIILMTTSWVAQDKNSDIRKLLELLPTHVEGYYSDFTFKKSRSDVLKLYDKGEAKEGVGAGGALGYAALNNVDEVTLLNQIEVFVGL